MRILVIDDASWNQESARETLKDHDVTIVGTVEDAYCILDQVNSRFDKRIEPFDAVLTDMWMPTPKGSPDGDQEYIAKMGKSYYTTRATDGQFDDQLPAGLGFALAALDRGMPTAICTDTDHHIDRLGMVLDLIALPYRRGPVVYLEARDRCCRDRVYDTETKQIVVWPSEDNGHAAWAEKYPGTNPRFRYIKDWSEVLRGLLNLPRAQ